MSGERNLTQLANQVIEQEIAIDTTELYKLYKLQFALSLGIDNFLESIKYGTVALRILSANSSLEVAADEGRKVAHVLLSVIKERIMNHGNHPISKELKDLADNAFSEIEKYKIYFDLEDLNILNSCKNTMSSLFVTAHLSKLPML